MDNSFYHWVLQSIEQWIVYAFVFFIAILGGLVRHLYDHKGTFSMKDLMKDILASGLVALLTLWACDAMKLSPPYTAVLIGICAHLGTRALVLGQKFAMNKLKLNIEVKEDK